MIYRKKYQESLKMSAESESMFERVCALHGYACTKATPSEDMKEHIDFWIESKQGSKWAIDVKARKSIERGGATQDEWIWIELLNVRGKKGWMSGNSHFIAFEMAEGFHFVKPIDLQVLVSQKVTSSQLVSSASLAKYRLYTRQGRQDLITSVQKQDIVEISSMFLSKEGPTV